MAIMLTVAVILLAVLVGGLVYGSLRVERATKQIDGVTSQVKSISNNINQVQGINQGIQSLNSNLQQLNGELRTVAPGSFKVP
jgi:hypothetical protein